jgi:hypothetical protein
MFCNTTTLQYVSVETAASDIDPLTLCVERAENATPFFQCFHSVFFILLKEFRPKENFLSIGALNYL